MLENCLFVRRAWLQDTGNSAALQRFLKATIKGWLECRGIHSIYYLVSFISLLY